MVIDLICCSILPDKGEKLVDDILLIIKWEELYCECLDFIRWEELVDNVVHADYYNNSPSLSSLVDGGAL